MHLTELQDSITELSSSELAEFTSWFIEFLAGTEIQQRRCLVAEDVGDVTVVNFLVRKLLDDSTVASVGKNLFSLVDDLGRHKLVINLKNIEFLSSAALGKLITLNRKIAAVRGKLALCEIDPAIHEVLEITKLNQLFRIYRLESQALQLM